MSVKRVKRWHFLVTAFASDFSSFFLHHTFAGLWAFLWFVGFCFLANQWSRTSPNELPLEQASDAARAAIAFSFFSILTWVRQAGENPAHTHTHTSYLTVNFAFQGYLCLLSIHRFKNIAFLEDKQRLLSKPPPTLALV